MMGLHAGQLWFITAMLTAHMITGQGSCDLATAVGLSVQGLDHYSKYNGDYTRGPRAHLVHDRPTFWKALGIEGTCTGSLENGECSAMTWISLESGNASAAACQKACEAERTNGCCRFGTADPERGVPAGCAMGNGRTFYDWRQSAAKIGKCAGQAFIFYCEADRSWNLAPPSAWDTIGEDQCFDAETQSYYHSVAIGPQNGSLEDGFEREWGANLESGYYVLAKVKISYECPGDPTPESATAAATAAASDEESEQSWILPVLIAGAAALVLLSAAVVFLLCRAPKVVTNGVPGAVLSPDQELEASTSTIVVGRPLGGSERSPKVVEP